VTGPRVGGDLASREKVYAAERSLPPMDRLLGISDAWARNLMREHLGVPGYIIRLDGHPAKLFGFWQDSPALGRVPVITAPPGYTLSLYEAAHEIAHLATDRDGPRLGHCPQFIRNYLHILRNHPRLRDALRDLFERHGVTSGTGASQSGFFPGDDLAAMPPGGPRAQWVKIARVAAYAEWRHDRDTGVSRSLLTGETCRDPYTSQRWAELIQLLRQDGFREPLILEYDPRSRRAYLGEGNHRLVAADACGYAAVPVRGFRRGDSERIRGARRVPGVPVLTPDGHGYFPSGFRPSDVLPRSWLYQGENPQFCGRCGHEFPRGAGPEHVAAEHPREWRQAWDHQPGLRGKYPHLAPQPAALLALDDAGPAAGLPVPPRCDEPGRRAAARRRAAGTGSGARTARPGSLR